MFWRIIIMTAISYIIVILGAASVAINTMRFIDRIDQPRRRRHAA